MATDEMDATGDSVVEGEVNHGCVTFASSFLSLCHLHSRGLEVVVGVTAHWDVHVHGVLLS